MIGHVDKSARFARGGLTLKEIKQKFHHSTPVVPGVCTPTVLHIWHQFRSGMAKCWASPYICRLRADNIGLVTALQLQQTHSLVSDVHGHPMRGRL